MSVNIRDLMEEIKGATFVGVSYESKPDIKGGKKNPFVESTVKHVVGANCQAFTNKNKNGYEQKVKRRLEKEGKSADDFQLSPRKWGTRLENMPIVEHKGEYYLELIFNNSGKVHYTVDGVETPAEKITGLKVGKDEGKQGDLEDKVIIRTIKLSNVKELKINGNVIKNPYFK